MPSQQQAEDAVIPVGALVGRGELILVVDDEGAVRRVLERMLVAAGFRVLVAADGVAGTERFRSHRQEIVLVISASLVKPFSAQALLERVSQALLDRPPASSETSDDARRGARR